MHHRRFFFCFGFLSSLFLRLLLLQIMRWGGMVSTADHLIRIVGRTRGRGCMWSSSIQSDDTARRKTRRRKPRRWNNWDASRRRIDRSTRLGMERPAGCGPPGVSLRVWHACTPERFCPSASSGPSAERLVGETGILYFRHMLRCAKVE